MSNRTSTIGAGLLALLAIVDIVLLFIAFDPPTEVLAIVLVLDLVVLVALGVWAAGRSPRIAMWVAVIAVALTALMAILPLVMPDIPVGERVYSAIFLVLAATGIFMVRGELGRSRRGAPSSTARTV